MISGLNGPLHSWHSGLLIKNSPKLDGCNYPTALKVLYPQKVIILGDYKLRIPFQRNLDKLVVIRIIFDDFHFPFWDNKLRFVKNLGLKPEACS